MTKLIAWLTSILFSLVAIGSFALSYNALRAIAVANGIPDNWLGDIWPLLIDVSLVVFSLAVVTAHLYSESTRKQWVLVTIYTIATVMFNMLHAPDSLLARVIAAVPPISLFFSFELLMEQLRNSVTRKIVTQPISTDNTEQVTSDYLTLELLPTDNHVMPATNNTANNHTDAVPTDNHVTTRRQQVATLKGKVTQSDIAKQLGVSVSTIRNDMKVLNGHN